MSQINIYQTLIPKIKATLEKIDLVKEIFAYAESKIAKNPAVIFFPDYFENGFDSVQENYKIVRFKMFVYISGKQLTKSQLMEDKLPKAVDAIINQFDEDWNQGTGGGHRITMVIDSGFWDISETQDGNTGIVDLTLTFKLLTNIS